MVGRGRACKGTKERDSMAKMNGGREEGRGGGGGGDESRRDNGCVVRWCAEI